MAYETPDRPKPAFRKKPFSTGKNVAIASKFTTPSEVVTPLLLAPELITASSPPRRSFGDSVAPTLKFTNALVGSETFISLQVAVHFSLPSLPLPPPRPHPG